MLGYISDISKEEYQENPFSKLNNAKSGKIGIEKSLDKELRGQLGSKSIEINAFGREIRELKRIEGKVGKSVQLTIDSDVQNFCFDLLKGLSGSISVIDVNTGNYIALASAPAFDPNKFSDGISSSDWQNLLSNKYKPLINKSISSYYPPGSTIKPLVALAAPDDHIPIRLLNILFLPFNYDVTDICFGSVFSLLTISLLSAFMYAFAEATKVSVWEPWPTTDLPFSDNLTETSACASVPSVTACTW